MQAKIQKIGNFKKFYESSLKLKSRHYVVFVSTQNAVSAEVSSPGLTGGSSPLISFAAVASKKGVHKSAVKRNRAKRRLKNAFSEYLKTKKTGELDPPVKPGDDIYKPGDDISAPHPDIKLVFMANRSILTCPWPDLMSQMRRTCDPIFTPKS